MVCVIERGLYLEEIWKEIEYGGLKYLVSNYGKIKGFKRGLLKQRINLDGYYEITAGINELRTRVRVHKLVALTFIENPNNLPEVNHKDFNRLNNYYKNLEWCTHEYNIQYSAKYNNEVVCESKRGSKNGNSKLTEDIVIHIRDLFDKGKRIFEISNMLNISWSTVNRVVKRENWNHI